MKANHSILTLIAVTAVSVLGLNTPLFAIAGETKIPNKSEYLIAKKLSCSRALVTAKTGSLLYVRDKPAPTGKKIGSYKNAAGVRIEKYSANEKWALVYPDSRVDKTPQGWVWAPFLKCP